MHRTFLILVLAAGLSACASTATDVTAEGDDALTATAEGDGVATTVPETKKPKKSCYREKVSGSRVGIRFCKTVGE